MRSNEVQPTVPQAAQGLADKEEQTRGANNIFRWVLSALLGRDRSLCVTGRGHAIAFVDVSEKGADLGNGLGCGDAMRRFHVRLPDGTLLSGARAFVAVWASLPGWRWAARLARIPGVTPVLESGLSRLSSGQAGSVRGGGILWCPGGK